MQAIKPLIISPTILGASLEIQCFLQIRTFGDGQAVNGRPNILTLYGTGIRRAQAANPKDENGVAESVSVTVGGRPARVLYAGAQGRLDGLDQITFELPAELAGMGRGEVVISVNGVTINRAMISIK